MKIAILSDFHFGHAKFYEDSFLHAKRALEVASNSDLMILAGDLFDSRVPKQEVFAKSFELFAPISQKMNAKIISEHFDGTKSMHNTAIVAIPGTHERRPKEFVNAVEVLEKAGFLVSAHASKVFFEKNGEKIVVQGLGGVPEQFAKSALKTLNFQPVKNAFNIFVFHQTMQEFVPTNEEYFITKNDLPNGFDLYICGHIHWRREMEIYGKRLLIPGSTLVTQLRKNEMGEKGVIFYDTKTNNQHFEAIKTRPFYFAEMEFKNATPNEILEKCEAFIKEKISQDKPIIKIKLTGTLDKAIIDQNISFSQLLKYKNDAFIEIDKDFEISELKEQILYLQKIKEGQISIKEQGLQLLNDKIKEMGLKENEIHDFFEAISEGEKIEYAASLIRRILH